MQCVASRYRKTDEGIELQSAAGTAKYDAWGARREVNGIPEYFPSPLSR
jgi:hypothetical protein